MPVSQNFKTFRKELIMNQNNIQTTPNGWNPFTGCGTLFLLFCLIGAIISFFRFPEPTRYEPNCQVLNKAQKPDDEAAVDIAVDAVVEEAVEHKEEIKENAEALYQKGKEKAKETVKELLSPESTIHVSEETEAAVDLAAHAGINNAVEAGVENKEIIKEKGKKAYRDLKKTFIKKD